MDSRYWTKRTCAKCNKEFDVRTCYTQRGQGKYCSTTCRLTAPRPVSELVKTLGPKEAKKYYQKELFYKTRVEALSLLSNDATPKCSNCSCSVLPILEVNHRNGGGAANKESGIKLWRIVLKLGEQAGEFFNVLCKVCNQLDYVERHFQVKGHRVLWENQA